MNQDNEIRTDDNGQVREAVRMAMLDVEIKTLNVNIVDLIRKVDSSMVVLKGNGSRESVENCVTYRLMQLEKAEKGRSKAEFQSEMTQRDIITHTIKIVMGHLVTAIVAAALVVLGSYAMSGQTGSDSNYEYRENPVKIQP